MHKTLLSLSDLMSTLHSSHASARAAPHTGYAPAGIAFPHNPFPASVLTAGLHSGVTFSSPP